VILFPTDTLYGLGADAFSDEAVDKIYAIKGRDEKKPMHCIVADIEAAQQYAEVSDDARLLAQQFFPGALTLIMKKKSAVAGGIARGMTTLGIRVPKNDFCLTLARAYTRPFTATSANMSGHESPRSVDAILAQLGPLADAIDLIIDAGELTTVKPSTVVDLSSVEPYILREGAIDVADIWNTLRAEA
jgi:L-threonylcarbamoyladenylate synthase